MLLSSACLYLGRLIVAINVHVVSRGAAVCPLVDKKSKSLVNPFLLYRHLLVVINADPNLSAIETYRTIISACRLIGQAQKGRLACYS